MDTTTFWYNPDRIADLVRIIRILNDKTERKATNGNGSNDGLAAQIPCKKGRARKEVRAVSDGGVSVPVIHNGVVFQTLPGEAQAATIAGGAVRRITDSGY